MKFKYTIIGLSLVTILTGCNSVMSTDVSATAKEGVTSLDKFFSDTGAIVTPATYPTDETSHQMLKNQDLVHTIRLQLSMYQKARQSPFQNYQLIDMYLYSQSQKIIVFRQ